MGTDAIKDALTLARSITNTNNSSEGAALGRRPAASVPDAAMQRIEKSGDEVPAPSSVIGESSQLPEPSYSQLRTRLQELEKKQTITREKTNARVKRYRDKKRHANDQA